jgi:hypothetical protein
MGPSSGVSTNRMATKPVLAFATFAVALGFAASACSIASGWGDLQGGDRKVDAGAAPDAEADGQIAAESGAFSGEAGLGPTCGAARCSSEQSCCVNFNAQGVSCVNGASCPSGGAPLRCSNERDCPLDNDGHDQLCCFRQPLGGSSCARRCDPADLILCDPSGDACPDGRSCEPDTITSGLFSCR